MYHYSSPPGGWAPYDYGHGYAPPPPPPQQQQHHLHQQHYPYYYYHAAQYAAPQTPPRPKRHAYRASYSAAKDGSPWYPTPPPGYQAWQNYYEGVPDYAYSPPQPRKHEHVSATFRRSSGDRGFGFGFGGPARGARGRNPPESRWQNQYSRQQKPQRQYQPFAGTDDDGDGDFDDDDEDEDGVYDSQGDDELERDNPFVFRFARRSHTRPTPYAGVDDDDTSDSSSTTTDDEYACLFGHHPATASRSRPRDQRRHYFTVPRQHMPSSSFSSARRHHHRHHSHQEPPRRRMPGPNPTADQYFCYNQVPPSFQREADQPRRSRARRASTSARAPPPKPKPSAKSPPLKATEEDAIRAGIPSGYSIKNWDPTEAPILLLGSVFDANSLGKWIYDWTIFHYGAMAPMADVAGELWLLLIRLAGKVKRADDTAPLIRSPDPREIVEDFLESGERLWTRFKKLLKACEHFMWKTARREGSAKGAVTMGRNAGCEFVDSIFGRDRELENTEKLMNSIRLWDMRFDANCDDILKRPETA